MKNNQLSDESGYAMVLAILMLAVLMIAGVMSSSNSVSDLSVARSTVIHSQNTALAESAAMTAVSSLELLEDENDLYPEKKTDDFIVADPNDDRYSSADKVPVYKDAVMPSAGKRKSGSGTPRYYAIGWSQPRDTGLGMSGPILKDCRVIGEYISGEYGSYRVEMGFKKRF